ncbi:MAG: transketolase [Spartobacteria bacterium]|nr:transketolase [Spartobacteria bacterium]
MKTETVADIIRGLAMDAVQQANSGHPGAPMGLADFASVLFLKHLKYNPEKTNWPDRDRFVLSPGHASTLLYSLLHLAGYGLDMDQLKNFRQWDSLTPGHPEYGLTPGVETTTGPLGQGSGNAVGMALAEAVMAERFNEDDATLVDHHTYAIVSDGDLMEGISHEVFSLAGHLKLGKLIAFYDSNRITIEGQTDLAYSEDTRKRMESYGWHVLEVDGHDHAQIDEALTDAKAHTAQPSLIIGHTLIGKGSPNKQGTANCHGSPLGKEEIALTKAALGLPVDTPFYVPEEVYSLFAERKQVNLEVYRTWERTLAAYREKYPDETTRWEACQHRLVPEDISTHMPAFEADASVATRIASGKVLQALNKTVPALLGGSADLGPSNNTEIKDGGSIGPGRFSGANIHFGIREHGMGAVMNGMALHGDIIPYGGTFLVFADYCRPAIRLAALMELQTIYVFTHDSIFLGEDGPTHQAVEQLASLRAIPNLTVIRPADATETAAAWQVALARKKGPTALLLTRQGVPVINRSIYPPADLLKSGAYILWQSREGHPDFILIASGSEVSICLDAARKLAEDNIIVRVVSMPSWELFEEQTPEVKHQILPQSCIRRLAVEAGCDMGWERYVGEKGRTITINRFGASAPHTILAEKFGFTPENILRTARDML